MSEPEFISDSSEYGLTMKNMNPMAPDRRLGGWGGGHVFHKRSVI
jgi:hypothetical protein